MKTLEQLFGTAKPLIGVVHLPPSVGFDGYPGPEAYISHAVADAQALKAGGADAILVENDNDRPHTILATEAQRNSISAAVTAIRSAVSIQLGVNVLLNDWKATLDIAAANGCSFVRIDVFVDRVSCDAGIIEAEADAIVAYRNTLAQQIALFTDIQVKHKTMLDTNKPLTQSAQEAVAAGSSALIVSGRATGVETPLERIRTVKHAFPDFPLLVGAGITRDNIRNQVAVADGIIVGSSIKKNNAIDVARVRELVQLIKKVL